MTPHERRALARALSAIASATVAEALQLDPTIGDECPLVGITGPPGAGKSTLIAELAAYRATSGGLAIVAIDPTSPISGGALLGDRIRMGDLVDNPHIYIRSLASRGSFDGLADNLPGILQRLASAGFAEVLLETVGVGQIEYAVRDLVDTMVLVLTPGAGDQVQAMKSGVLEVPHIFVVNKADQPGAEQLAAEIRDIIHHRAIPLGRWSPLIVLTAAGQPRSVSDLSTAIDAHRIEQVKTGDRADAWKAHIIRNLMARRTREIISMLDREKLKLPLIEIFSAVANSIGSKGHESAIGQQPVVR